MLQTEQAVREAQVMQLDRVQLWHRLPELMKYPAALLQTEQAVNEAQVRQLDKEHN